MATRREREDRKFQARFEEFFRNVEPQPVRTTGPAGRPIISDKVVTSEHAPRVVVVRCRCGANLRGVRKLADGRILFGVPWIALEEDGRAIFPITCPECGAEGSVKEQVILDAVRTNRQTIRIGRRRMM